MTLWTVTLTLTLLPQPRALSDSLDSDSDGDELQSILAESRGNLAVVQAELERRAADADATYVSKKQLHCGHSQISFSPVISACQLKPISPA